MHLKLSLVAKLPYAGVPKMCTEIRKINYGRGVVGCEYLPGL